MMRQRRGAPVEEEESSSDEEDAFSKLSRKKGKKDNKKVPPANVGAPGPQTNTIGNATNASSTNNLLKNQGTASIANDNAAAATAMQQQQLPASTTSSMKRHHTATGANANRKAKMDALLVELAAETSRRPINTQERGRGFVPEKKGSFVDPSEEHLTTNIFVGNLAPSITEEELTDLFRQFGDLYSVKIMWPRTPEERARNRNTGFVCFMTREDAEDAMVCDNTDPFNVGRQIMMRWGKNVKKVIKRGTGGVAVAPIRKRAAGGGATGMLANNSNDIHNKRLRTESAGDTTPTIHSQSSATNPYATKEIAFDPEKHAKDAIRVLVPRPPSRALFISTVASFVAKDGNLLEKKLLEIEAANPDFSFLTIPKDQKHQQQQYQDHLFYRWRVYAFCQGDGFNVWRTEPFRMMQPNGLFWIPPALNHEAAWQEEQERKRREESIEQQKKQRRRRVMTGRQLEQARRRNAGAADGGAQLTREEMQQFDLLVRRKLCASRDAICEAMAFCFEKSGAAKQIARMLEDIILEDESSHPGISVETRIARLYLLSDVLFNSQQPGVKNAFLYRDSVERMAPGVFTSLGKHGSGTLGRMRRNKLTNAVSAVLGAWTNWSVYNPIFLDELYARFEGREIKKEPEDDNQKDAAEIELSEEEDVNANAVKVIEENQRGDWTEVGNDHAADAAPESKAVEDSPITEDKANASDTKGKEKSNNDDDNDDDMDGDAIDEDDIDGEPLEEDDLDGEPLEEGDLDGDAVDEADLDGEALDDTDVDKSND